MSSLHIDTLIIRLLCNVCGSRLFNSFLLCAVAITEHHVLIWKFEIMVVTLYRIYERLLQ